MDDVCENNSHSCWRIDDKLMLIDSDVINQFVVCPRCLTSDFGDQSGLDMSAILSDPV